LVIAVPPLSDGDVKFTVSVPLAVGEILEIVGAAGVVVGVPDTAVLGSPAPCVLIARIITEYVVPLSRLGTITGLLVEDGERVTHVAPSSSEYS
jgi:hypothetical protein